MAYSDDRLPDGWLIAGIRDLHSGTYYEVEPRESQSVPADFLAFADQLVVSYTDKSGETLWRTIHGPFPDEPFTFIRDIVENYLVEYSI